MHAVIEAIQYHLPERVVSNRELAAEFPGWPLEKIEARTGIQERHIAAEGECASDLAVAAARKLFASGAVRPADIDFLLFCTQTPDYFLPATACLLQDRLGLPQSAGALDFNLGSSGFVYGLGLAQGLIETGQARRVLLATADTYSRFLHPGDKSVRTIFGDAASVTLVSGTEDERGACLGPYVYGTDGSGGEYLMVPAGGMRQPRSAETAAVSNDASGNTRSRNDLFMDGGEIFAFTVRVVPKMVSEILERAGRKWEEIDLVVCHQPNQYMLEHLRDRMGIAPEKFFIGLRHCGNTVSSTIPIALRMAQDEGRLKPGDLALLAGFGVGYSWGATLVRWGPARA